MTDIVWLEHKIIFIENFNCTGSKNEKYDFEILRFAFETCKAAAPVSLLD